MQVAIRRQRILEPRERERERETIKKDRACTTETTAAKGIAKNACGAISSPLTGIDMQSPS